MPVATLRMSQVVVIESLKNGDWDTARELVEDISPSLAYWGSPISMSLKRVGTKDELFSLLEDLSAQASSGIALHLEVHGSEDGWELRNGDQVKWAELVSALTTINLVSGCNLLVTCSACFGIYLASVVQPTDRAFAWAVIGPAKSASAGYLLQRFQGFYKVLLKTGDGEAALAYLRSKDGLPGPKCHVASAYGLFRASYENYLRDHCTPEQYPPMPD